MRKERPSDDADAAEIARWMEDDFGRAVADGIRDAAEDAEDEDSQDSS
jgi:hypothetical protein